MSDRVRHIIGCMTGTSLDGLDAALVRIEGRGLAMTANFLAMESRPLAELASLLKSMADGSAHPPLDYLRAARHLGNLHADAAEALARRLDTPCRVDFVVAHGQTIWHDPADRTTGAAGLSWQLFDPWPVAQRLGVPVCHDLRQADLIAGGEGAPITPLSDWIMYRGQADLIVNLGGIANVTRLAPEPQAITGGDIGPCNLLIDGLCQRLFNQPFDRDGHLSAVLPPDERATSLVARAVDEVQARSLGREQFHSAWLDDLVASLHPLGSPAASLAGAITAVGRRIGACAAQAGARRVVLAGGGARNPTLVGAIRAACGADVRVTDELGIPCEAREAMGFAVLGALSRDGVPISLPRVTGSVAPGVAGCWIGR